MKITEVKISLRSEDRLKAFANVTFDDEFVVRGLKVIEGNSGYFVSMPSRRRPDGTYQDIAHPINNEMRSRLEEVVLTAYNEMLGESKEEENPAEENPVEENPVEENPDPDEQEAESEDFQSA
jgi:stage V sporulation protein G